jgi:hypothetical protein
MSNHLAILVLLSVIEWGGAKDRRFDFKLRVSRARLVCPIHSEVSRARLVFPILSESVARAPRLSNPFRSVVRAPLLSNPFHSKSLARAPRLSNPFRSVARVPRVCPILSESVARAPRIASPILSETEMLSVVRCIDFCSSAHVRCVERTQLKTDVHVSPVISLSILPLALAGHPVPTTCPTRSLVYLSYLPAWSTTHDER